MGNRAVIAFEDDTGVQSFGVYLHWNGGPESVWAFLDVLTTRMRSRGDDVAYASARLVEIVGRYFGGNTSVGLLGFGDSDADKLGARDDVEHLDLGDNGIYVVAWDEKLKRYAIAAHYVDSKWLRPNEITAEEGEARSHDYWKYEPDRATIVENVTYCAAYPGSSIDAYAHDSAIMKADILKARTGKKPRRRKAA
jgi:hypothetical protein